MGLNFILLFLTAMIAGSLVFFAPNFKDKYFKLVLVFAGSYLFSITIIHIIPELFSSATDASKMGLYILIGFLFQQILEFLSSGIEHGHIHLHHHGHGKSGVLTVMLGLFIHSFLEGTLLSHGTLIEDVSSSVGHVHSGKSVLLGIIMHKGPAAFALAAVLSSVMSKKWTLILLTLFALSSPLGMFSSSFLFQNDLIGKEGIGILYGLVAGGFLHISTTIFFESSPHHKLQISKLMVSFLAAGLAIISEFLL
ncbi:ZIP family metal transporter [Algoriphagus zhangzhouensis]|uniref:Zinc transporter ZupT n=1 Tax=Algoriphagus zhangzhouensis TaxID=1073327 RepID=A0A1M7ZBZ5_9BACT|nr:ZIP family metal transporter [Algoriphagus zhangzhouensis]TDY46825.1 zinc transporter ZupT [Algoriphagus zhangzhouensis]SHO62216.1 Zinc transporter ZupT [Algoriphagus zhangzhouensis]